jgi:hypothetical protein
MIEKIKQLKNQTGLSKVKELCETAISGLSSALYNNVTPEARYEIEAFSVKNLFEGLGKVEDEKVKTWLSNQKRVYAIKNLGVRESINSLLGSEGKTNYALKATLENFKVHIENEIPEVRLYEEFISAMQSFSYFPKVGNAIKAIEDRVDNYKSDVSISKIIETMKETRSNYLIPLIEDAVQNYLDNKTTQNKSFLKEMLIKFSYDPFVRDIINLVTLDATELQLEYANAQCDIEKVYSPILYLGENEAVFSVKGLFYVKKGNIVSRLYEKDTNRLDREFVNLCEAINNPNVIITSKNITVYEGKDKAVITDSKVIINEKEISAKEFAEGAEIAHWTGKGSFLLLIETLRKNFNEIAEVDFAKRVYLKENENHAADVFKLRGNVFISTHSSVDGKSTFYRNINPIQAKGIMMEHLRYDVSRLFEGLLPEEEKIMEEIEETKKEYTNYISLLESKISEFNNELSKTNSLLSKKVIDALLEELSEIQNDYKDYLNVAEKYIRPIGEAITISVDVDGKKYTVPIPTNGEVANQNAAGAEQTDGQNSDTEAGTEVGTEDISKQPASAVTFQDDQTELLGDTPTIGDDEVNMGSDQAEADADKAEADAKSKEGEENKEGGETASDTEEAPEEMDMEKDTPENGAEGAEKSNDLEGGKEDEIKIEDDSDKDEDDKVEGDEKKEKTEESAESSEIKKESSKKRRVFLKKKATK